ncbi:MAG: hypothetical protein QGG01_05705, partial [Roseibacillus sp.]|nr:hypothetical protein [Roseibacillus sp.]
MDALEMMLGEVPLIDWIRQEKVDPRAGFREGFDLMPEPEMEEDEDFDGFDLDDEDEDDMPEWEGGSFDGSNTNEEGGVFDFGPVRPFTPSQTPSSMPADFDLGLDDLQFELDLDGGSINADLDDDLSDDFDASVRSEPPSMGSSVFNPVDESREWRSADPSRRGGVSVFRSGSQRKEEENSSGSDDRLRGFDLGPPSSAGGNTADRALLKSPGSRGPGSFF